MIDILIGLGLYYYFSIDEKASIGKMNTHRFIPVFKRLPKDGTKYNIGFTKGKTGVYIIKENGIIVYIGYSYTDLYPTITRHFQNWNHRYQRVVTYANLVDSNRYTIRVVLTHPNKAKQLEEALTTKYQPRDNYDIVFPDEFEEEALIEKQHKKVIAEYENTDKWDYPPDWD